MLVKNLLIDELVEYTVLLILDRKRGYDRPIWTLLDHIRWTILGPFWINVNHGRLILTMLADSRQFLAV